MQRLPMSPNPVSPEPITAAAAAAIAQDQAYLQWFRARRRSRRRRAASIARLAATSGGLATGLAAARLAYAAVPGLREPEEDFARFCRRLVGSERLAVLEVPESERGPLWRSRDRWSTLAMVLDFFRHSLQVPRDVAALHRAYADIFGPVFPFMQGVACADYDQVRNRVRQGQRRTRPDPRGRDAMRFVFTGVEPTEYLQHTLIPHFLDQRQVC
ncbi:MAG: hypothetical protein AAF602_25655 [Myxococcota bacterium]